VVSTGLVVASVEATAVVFGVLGDEIEVVGEAVEVEDIDVSVTRTDEESDVAPANDEDGSAAIVLESVIASDMVVSGEVVAVAVVELTPDKKRSKQPDSNQTNGVKGKGGRGRGRSTRPESKDGLHEGWRRCVALSSAMLTFTGYRRRRCRRLLTTTDQHGTCTMARLGREGYQVNGVD
jgi:hypothetical protein